MDWFRYGHGVIFTIATQFLLLVFLLSSKPVEAEDDKTLVRKICSQTLEPNVCLNCISADTGRGTSNITDLTYSVLFCMYSQAIYAHQCADHLFQNTAAVQLKKSFQVCKDVLFSASNTLWDGLTKLEVSDYKNAHLSAGIAHLDLFQCVFAFRRYANVPIPSVLLNYMVQTKRLFDVAQFMFLLI
ncbi:Pectinesterase inhibitor domain - like 7 [Theobroma cacao]|nr:Pectinesterase inhibitor domain - like 7 [Theobroma cacao]